MDKNNYFYPQYEDGQILRRSLVDGTEQNVLEVPSDTEEDNIIEQAEENIQEAEIPNEEEDFDVTNFPENENLRKIFIEERFIEAVQRRPPLWNFKLPVAQRGVRKKEKLWEDVVAVMKGVVTLAEAK